MAVGGEQQNEMEKWSENLEEQQNEILALKSIYEGQRCLHILRSPEEEAECHHGCYILQIAVTVKSERAKHHIEAYILAEDEDLFGGESTGDVANSGKPVPLQRTVSGAHFVGGFEVKHLSPVTLQISLPVLYPSTAPPAFTLSCFWLTAHQLGNLCHQLDRLWVDCSGMPIIFTWTDWLENNTLSFLGLKDDLMLTAPSNEKDMDPRVCLEYDDLTDIINGMMRYNRQQQTMEFCKNHQECGVCLDEKPGSSFFLLSECRHHVCQSCMTAYCQMHVQQGTINELQCPDSKCNTKIPQCVLKEVLECDEFDRWERLVLQKSLDMMDDIVYCPRCQKPVIKEEEEELHLAHCTNCFFTFCTECNESSHQGQKCLQILEKLEKLNEMHKKEDGNQFLRIKELIEEEYKSNLHIKVKTRPCPRCRTKIQKDGGCNKVMCTQCNCAMCWACGKDITKASYQHFADSMKCGEIIMDDQRDLVPLNFAQQPEAILRINAALEVDPKAKKNKIKCPSCKQFNLKNLDGNNHIKCWSCKCNFCFVCKKCIMGTVTSHYIAASLCKQHS